MTDSSSDSEHSKNRAWVAKFNICEKGTGNLTEQEQAIDIMKGLKSFAKKSNYKHKSAETNIIFQVENQHHSSLNPTCMQYGVLEAEDPEYYGR